MQFTSIEATSGSTGWYAYLHLFIPKSTYDWTARAYHGLTFGYSTSSGMMHTGWLPAGGAWYCFTDSGVMVTGVVWVDGRYQRFNSGGVWLGVY